MLIVIAFIGIGLWFLTSKSEEKENSSTSKGETTSQNQEQRTAEETQIDNDRFRLTLPEGFASSSERFFTFTAPPEKHFTYVNAQTGDYFEINYLLPNAGSGYSPDFTWYFTQGNDGGIVLEKPTTEICDSQSDEWCTTSGDGRLDAYVSSKDNSNYYLTFGNTKNETPNDLVFVDEFIKNLTIK